MILPHVPPWLWLAGVLTFGFLAYATRETGRMFTGFVSKKENEQDVWRELPEILFIFLGIVSLIFFVISLLR